MINIVADIYNDMDFYVDIPPVKLGRYHIAITTDSGDIDLSLTKGEFAKLLHKMLLTAQKEKLYQSSLLMNMELLGEILRQHAENRHCECKYCLKNKREDEE